MTEVKLDPVSNLYINLASIDAVSDLLNNAASEGDITALNTHTITNAMNNIHSLVEECTEAVGQIDQELQS